MAHEFDYHSVNLLIEFIGFGTHFKEKGVE